MYKGLYYPYIHFRDDAWLKLAALYWDEVGRIVPASLEADDSDVVKRLQDELGFIRNIRPDHDATYRAGETFLKFIREHKGTLSQRYGISTRNAWNPAPKRKTLGPPQSDPRLVYLEANEKIAPDLRKELSKKKLGKLVDGPREHEQWMGLHPQVALIYMAVLADEIAKLEGWNPLTDDMQSHVAASGWSTERLALALLDDPQLATPNPTEYEVEGQLATIALEYAIPRNIADVPIDKIIAVRKQHKDEFAAFQSLVREVTTDVQKDIQHVRNPVVINEHLQDAYNEKIKPKVDNLRVDLRGSGFDTARSFLTVQVTLPIIETVTDYVDVTVDPTITTVGTVAFGLFTVLRDRRLEWQNKMHNSDVSFLMRVEEELSPNDLISQIKRSTRKVLGPVFKI